MSINLSYLSVIYVLWLNGKPCQKLSEEANWVAKQLPFSTNSN